MPETLQCNFEEEISEVQGLDPSSLASCILHIGPAAAQHLSITPQISSVGRLCEAALVLEVGTCRAAARLRSLRSKRAPSQTAAPSPPCWTAHPRARA